MDYGEIRFVIIIYLTSECNLDSSNKNLLVSSSFVYTIMGETICETKYE